MKILAIETSCDETSVAFLEARGGLRNPAFRILSNVVSSQVAIHAQWGGVVPSLAKREHQRNLIPVLKRALAEANLLNKKQESKVVLGYEKKLKRILRREIELWDKTVKFFKKYRKPKIDLIAVTKGPGLEPALWVGINFAKALGFAWQKPLVAVNHMEGHFFSVFLKEKKKKIFQSLASNFQFPAVALLISGGHTQLVLVKDWLRYKILGETRDDAVGEAFDKVSRMLGLGYPGGPVIAAEAAKAFSSDSGSKIVFPRPMMNSDDYDFSFSGLKTAVLYKLKELGFGDLKKFKNIKKFSQTSPNFYCCQKLKPAIAREFQQAVIDVLISKTIRAAREYQAKTVVLAGGVAANFELTKQMKKIIQDQDLKLNLFIPQPKFCGDNGAMIGLAAYFRYLKEGKIFKIPKFQFLRACGNLKIR